jgi:hypothetical protein
VADTVPYAQPYGALLLAPEVPCLVVAWYGFANSEQFRGFLNRGLELYRVEAQHTKHLGWLADTRGHIRAADQQWLATDWNLRAYQAGIRHVRFVEPESVSVQITVNMSSSNALASTDHRLTPWPAPHPGRSRS